LFTQRYNIYINLPKFILFIFSRSSAQQRSSW